MHHLPLLPACCLFLAPVAMLPAATYHVSPSGSDGWAGSPANPLKTVGAACNKARPGDRVQIRAGTYVEQINLYANGDPNAWIVITADDPNNRPIIKARPGAYSVFSIGTMPDANLNGGVSASYYQLDNLVITSDAAQSPEANGIQIVNWSNHIRVWNCHVHHCGAGGIVTRHKCDYLDIRGNEVAYNCFTSIYQGSGISFLNNTWQGNETSYHSFIIDNHIYGNADRRSSNQPQHTDGNGIIIDSNLDGPYQTTIPYTSTPTLISRNRVHDNGGRGIWMFQTSDSTVQGNWTWNNNTDPQLIGSQCEVGCASATRVTIKDNSLSPSNSATIPYILVIGSTNLSLSGNTASNGTTPVPTTYR